MKLLIVRQFNSHNNRAYTNIGADNDDNDDNGDSIISLWTRQIQNDLNYKKNRLSQK